MGNIGTSMTNSQSRCDSPELKPRITFAHVVSFFFGSLLGVTIDLCAFEVAIFAEIPPLYANILSSEMAIVITYFFISRYTFNKNLSTKRFLLFIAYYAISIATFSLAIKYGVAITKWPAFLCKIFTLPASFAINLIFSNIILGTK